MMNPSIPNLTCLIVISLCFTASIVSIGFGSRIPDRTEERIRCKVKAVTMQITEQGCTAMASIQTCSGLCRTSATGVFFPPARMAIDTQCTCCHPIRFIRQSVNHVFSCNNGTIVTLPVGVSIIRSCGCVPCYVA